LGGEFSRPHFSDSKTLLPCLSSKMMQDWGMALGDCKPIARDLGLSICTDAKTRCLNALTAIIDRRQRQQAARLGCNPTQPR